MSQRAVLVVVWSRMSEMLATPFVALSGVRCPVSGCPRARVPGGGCAGVRSAGVRCPRALCPRPPCPRRGGSWSSVRRGQSPAVGTGRLRRDRLPVSASGRLFAGLAVAAAGGSRTGRGSRLQTWPPSWDALGRRLRPRSTAWPTRDSRLRARVAVGVVGDHGRGAGCVRRSPRWRMAARRSSYVSPGAGSLREALTRWLDQGGDYGAWSLGWGGTRSPGSRRAGGFDCEKGARPPCGPGMQRA